MKANDYEDIYRELITTYGEVNQENQAIEECAELINIRHILPYF